MEQNKNSLSVVLSIIGLLVGGAIGYYVGTSRSPEMPLASENDSQVSTSTVKSFGDSVLSFFDDFTLDKDMGTPRITIAYPDKKLILVEYPTSQETNAYAVVDYGNKKFYKGLFGGYITGTSVNAFLGSDKLVVWKYDEVTPNTIAIADFSGKIIKELLTLQPKEHIHQIYGNGPVVYVDVDINNTTKGDQQKHYLIDANTLTIVERGI